MQILKNRTKTQQKQTNLNVEEAHHLWEQTKTRYIIINHIQLISNYVHDIDYNLVLSRLNKSLNQKVNELEKMLNKYSLKSPEPNKTDINTLGSKEALSDKDSSRTLMLLFRFNIASHQQTLQNTTFNDGIRDYFLKMLKDEYQQYDDYLQFMKYKGWLEYPPLYPGVKDVKKYAAANEVYHLWNHLHFRYLNLQQTKFFSSYIIDRDFKIVAEMGLDILNKQINILEKRLLEYGVILPDKFPKNIPTPESKERFQDEYIFQTILTGTQNASALHGVSIQQIIVNDSLRRLFIDLLFEEVEYINNLIKYGKVKGWIPVTPKFRAG